jgi:hypothetical protein
MAAGSKDCAKGHSRLRPACSNEEARSMCHEARPALGGQQCRRVGTSSRTSRLGDLQAYRAGRETVRAGPWVFPDSVSHRRLDLLPKAPHPGYVPVNAQGSRWTLRGTISSTSTRNTRTSLDEGMARGTHSIVIHRGYMPICKRLHTRRP